jgi:hypothetical protein
VRVLVAALADHASISADDKLSINGIFDAIRPESREIFPLTLPIAYLALRLQLEYEDRDAKHTMEIIIENQDGKAFAKIEAELEIGPIPAGARIPINNVYQFQQLIFERPDKFSIVVLWDTEEKQRIPLDVAVQAPPSQP